MAGIARRTIVKSSTRPTFCGSGEAIVNTSYVTELTTDDLIEVANDFVTRLLNGPQNRCNEAARQ